MPTSLRSLHRAASEALHMHARQSAPNARNSAADAGGGASKTCIARACSQLKAKSRLRTKQAAAGLQQIILGLGEHRGKEGARGREGE